MNKIALTNWKHHITCKNAPIWDHGFSGNGRHDAEAAKIELWTAPVTRLLRTEYENMANTKCD